MFLSILLSIPGLLAILILLKQNWKSMTSWFSNVKDKFIAKTKFHFGVFRDIDDATYQPYIFYSTINSGFTSYNSASINTLYTNSTTISGSAISSCNGQDLILSNSASQVSVSQLVSAVNEIRVARQEICELKVKYGKRIHELEELLKEKNK